MSYKRCLVAQAQHLYGFAGPKRQNRGVGENKIFFPVFVTKLRAVGACGGGALRRDRERAGAKRIPSLQQAKSYFASVPRFTLWLQVGGKRISKAAHPTHTPSPRA